jgi:hypothetical protein
MGYGAFVKPPEDVPPPPESETPEALAGATGAETANEGHRQRADYHPDPRAATLIRRFGLAETLAGDVALLAWGAR